MTTCNAVYPHAPSTHCTLPDDHDGPHVTRRGDAWHDSPDYADGGMAAAAIEEAAGSDSIEFWQSVFLAEQRRAEKAEKERDELRQTRRRLLGKVDQLEVKLRNSGGSGEQPHPLAADNITDEMVKRAAHRMAMRGMPVTYSLDPTDTAANFYGRAREVLHAALTEPQPRPEGADFWDSVIADQVAGDLTPEAIQKLADTIALKTTENGA